MKVLVTGGAGYVGDAVVENLLKNGHDVSVVDNLTYSDSYMRDGIKFYNLDITDKMFWEWLASNEPFDSIVHLAALVGDGACAVDPDYTKVLNMKTAEWFQEYIRDYAPSCRFVFASTCSVYGSSDKIIDEDSDTAPLSVYAKTKLWAETHVGEMSNSVVFRLGTLFGMSTSHARIRTDLVANILTARACQNLPLTVFGGEQWRPLIHVLDVGRILAEAVDKLYTGTFILAHGNYKIIDIADYICDNILNARLETTDISFEDARNYRVDASRAKEFSIHTNIGLKTGIRLMVDAFRRGKIKDPWNIKYHNAKFIKENLNVETFSN